MKHTVLFILSLLIPILLVIYCLITYHNDSKEPKIIRLDPNTKFVDYDVRNNGIGGDTDIITTTDMNSNDIPRVYHINSSDNSIKITIIESREDMK